VTRPRLFLLVLGAALLAWLFAGVLFGGGMFAFRDTAHFYYPLLKLVTGEWAAGRVPLWNPYENLGQPLAANPTSSAFYPGLAVFALPLGYAWCFRIYVLGHLVLAALGAYGLARRFTSSVPAAGVAAMSYAFSGSVIFQHCNVVFLVGAAWLPVAMTAADRMLRQESGGRGQESGIRGRVAWAVTLGMVLALMVLGGDPQMAYHAGLIAAVYALWLWWTDGRAACRSETPDPEKRTIATLGRRLALLALAAVTAALLSAVQVLPSMEYAGRSNREVAGFADRLAGRIEPGTHSEHTYHFSVGPWRLAEYVWPNVFGRQFPEHRRWIDVLPAEGRVWVPSLYMGLLPLLLAVSAMRFWRNKRGSSSEHNTSGTAAPPPELRSDPFFTWLALLAVLASFGWYGLGWLVSEVSLLFGGEPGGPGPVPGPLGGIYWLMNALLPGYAYFRYPAKLLVVAALGLSVLAARGFDRVFGGDAKRFRRRILCLGALSAGGAVAALAVRPWWAGWMAMADPDVLFGPLDATGAANDLLAAFVQTMVLCGLLWWLTGTGRGQSPFSKTTKGTVPWPVLAAVVVVAVDLGVANRWLIATAPAGIWREEPQLAAVIDRHAEGNTGPAPVRVYRHPLWLPEPWRETGSPDRLVEAVRWDHDTLWPKYPLLLPLAVAEVHGTMMPGDYYALLGRAKSGGDVFRLGEYVVLPGKEVLLGGGRIDVPVGDVSLWHNPDRLPRAWIEHARVDDALAPVPSPRAGESCEIVGFRPSRVEIAAELAGPGTLVLAEQFYPGWQAVVHAEGEPGRPVEIERTREVMRGVRLPAGHYRIVYRYRPTRVLVGGVLSGAAWLAVALWGIAMVVRRHVRSTSSACRTAPGSSAGVSRGRRSCGVRPGG
jgi:hypothetical protein